jgi:malate dehydrogenase (oxaloacetate-decarboxylating)(NADP+)
MKVEGLSAAEARSRNWLFDSHGLVVKQRTGLAEHKVPYAHVHAPVGDFTRAIRAHEPTAIIGVAAVGGTFTPQVLELMAELNARPIVFALFNPTSKSECTAEQAYRRTQGRALFACGSPFDPVTIDGRTFVPRQGNNSYIFPGVGLGAIASRTRRITDEMFMGAAHALAESMSEADLAQGSLYPPLRNIREVSARIAARVARIAYASALTSEAAPNDFLTHVKSHMYEPRYDIYRQRRT